jgi:hypothetical protein
VVAVVSSGLSGDFQAIGQCDAPEVNAATGLYFSLNDMDAQVANELLVGNDTALAADKRKDLTRRWPPTRCSPTSRSPAPPGKSAPPAGTPSQGRRAQPPWAATGRPPT